MEITARQAQILDGLFRGLTAAQIARSLFVEEETVRSHRARRYRRLGANSAAQAVGLATSGQVTVQVRVDAFRAPRAAA